MTDITRYLKSIAEHYRIKTVCAVYQNNQTVIYQKLPDGDLIELKIRK